ncbi:hypothetical protein [Stackebrandtia soli]|uniref:hypothetical protein n=1 Tax=Stackebrandtia soli TaxID=1892856 RepID=UPI0039EB24D6
MSDTVVYYDEDGDWLGTGTSLGNADIQTADLTVGADGPQCPDCGAAPMSSVPDFWVANTDLGDDGVIINDPLALAVRPPAKPGPRPNPPLIEPRQQTNWLAVIAVFVVVAGIGALIWTDAGPQYVAPIMGPIGLIGAFVAKTFERTTKVEVDTSDPEFRKAVREHAAIRRRYAKDRNVWKNAWLCTSCEKAWSYPKPIASPDAA